MAGRNPAVAVLALLPSAGLIASIALLTGGHIVYMLDDAYIHLALARNLASGTYGINPGEFSAPSSSVAWPLLLAVFAPLGDAFEYVPLALNVCCLLLTIRIVAGLLSGLSDAARLFALACISLALNLHGLVMTGMEHSLQVLLAARLAQWLVTLGRCDATARDVPDWTGLACLVALPAVRYEGLALALPAIGFLFHIGRRRAAVISLLAIAGVLGTFSLFLHLNGLGLLPSSVLAKSTFSGPGGVLGNLESNLRQHGVWLAVVLAFAYSMRKRSLPLAAVVVCSALLHFLFGRHGWYGRYEVYFLIFTLVPMIACRRWTERTAVWGAAALCLLFPSLAAMVKVVPLAASNVFERQGRMAQIARSLNAPVAVNDLGLVAFRSGNHVLDLWGLGSRRALDLRTANRGGADWISTLMRESGARYAMVYDDWLPDRPAEWIRVGQLSLPRDRVSLEGPVSFYAVGVDAGRRLAAAMQAHRAADPSPRYLLTVEFSEFPR